MAMQGMLGSRLFATRLYAVACAALAVVEICASAPLPGLHPWLWTNEIVAWASGVVLLAASLWLLRRSQHRAGGWPLAALWLVAFSFAVFAAGQAPRDPSGWVAAAETLTLASAALAAPALAGREVRLALGLIVGATLILFGAVHWLFHDAIAGLIPAWMPFRPYWPYATGAVLVLAGLVIALDFATVWAVMAITAMFAGWIVVVHIPRLIGDPTSGFEWTFALTAVVLIAAVLLLDRGRRVATSSAAALDPAPPP